MGFYSSFHSDKFSTHQGQCGSCAHSSVSTSRLSCYCNKRRATYKLDEPKCRYYENDRSRNYDFWRDIYTYYVLTAICDILGIDKNNGDFPAEQLAVQVEIRIGKPAFCALHNDSRHVVPAD